MPNVAVISPMENDSMYSCFYVCEQTWWRLENWPGIWIRIQERIRTFEWERVKINRGLSYPDSSLTCRRQSAPIKPKKIKYLWYHHTNLNIIFRYFCNWIFEFKIRKYFIYFKKQDHLYSIIKSFFSRNHNVYK